MILVVYGTRPEYIKVGLLLEKMHRSKIPYKTLHTGQHRELLLQDATYKLQLEDHNEDRLNSILNSCIGMPKEWLENIDYILVQGDTTTALALALVAMNKQIKVIHLEAGLRTYNNKSPYPEEINRRLISTIAAIHLCPTELNKQNLLSEKISGAIHVVGNTSLDNLVKYKHQCEYTNIVPVTLHRRENLKDIEEWFRVIDKLAARYKELRFILPIHPNPGVLRHRAVLTNVEVVAPLSHEQFLNLLIKAKIVITDSGGIQEECSFLNKKCLVCRTDTERPEALGYSSFLIKNPSSLEEEFNKHITNPVLNEISPFGQGNTTDKIIEILKNLKYGN